MGISRPPPSVLIRFLRMMRNVLKRMKNQFSDFYFLSYDQFWIFLYNNFRWIFHDNSKNKKSENCFFIRFSTLRIILINRIKTVGGVCTSLVGKKPRGVRLSDSCAEIADGRVFGAGKNNFCFNPSGNNHEWAFLLFWNWMETLLVMKK